MSDQNLPMQACPILTAGVLARSKPVEVARVQMIGATPGTPDVAEPEAVACIGRNCMFFVTSADPATGKVTGGHCSFTAIPIVLGQLAAQLSKLMQDPSKQN